jgi:hypothetical protein
MFPHHCWLEARPGCAWTPVCIPLDDDDEEEDEEEEEEEDDEEDGDEECRDDLWVLALAALSMRAPCIPKETRGGLKDWLRLGGVFTLAAFGCGDAGFEARPTS